MGNVEGIVNDLLGGLHGLENVPWPGTKSIYLAHRTVGGLSLFLSGTEIQDSGV